MSTEGTDAPVVAAKTAVTPEVLSERQDSPGIGEGLGVFRGLLIMVLFYVAFGFLAWFGWHAFMQWRSH